MGTNIHSYSKFILKHEYLNLFINARKRRREQKKVSPRKHKEATRKHVVMDNPIISHIDEKSATMTQNIETFQRPSGVQKMVSFVRTKRKTPNPIQKTKREVERTDQKPKRSDKPPIPTSLQKRTALMKINRGAGGRSEKGSTADGQPSDKEQKSPRPNSIMKMAAFIKGKKKSPPEEDETASSKIAVVRPMDIYAKVDKKNKKTIDYELPEVETERSNQYTVLSKNKNSFNKMEKVNLKERKADETIMYENEDLYNITDSVEKDSTKNTCKKKIGKIRDCKKEGNLTETKGTENFDSLDPNTYENIPQATTKSENENEEQLNDSGLYENIKSKKDNDDEYEADDLEENSRQSISLPDNYSDPSCRRTSVV